MPSRRPSGHLASPDIEVCQISLPYGCDFDGKECSSHSHSWFNGPNTVSTETKSNTRLTGLVCLIPRTQQKEADSFPHQISSFGLSDSALPDVQPANDKPVKAHRTRLTISRTTEFPVRRKKTHKPMSSYRPVYLPKSCNTRLSLSVLLVIA